MTLNERLQEAFDKRVFGTAMTSASDLLSAMTAIEQAEADNAALKEQLVGEQSAAANYRQDAIEASKECDGLKEQVAQWETEYNGCSSLLNNAERTLETLEETIAQQADRIVELNKECNSHYETCQQQAEAIRLKDEALKHIASGVKANGCLTTINYCIDIADEALAIQPSPEILQARDEQVAEACAKIVNPSSLTYITRGDALTAIRSNEWRKYL